jgi:hypothetical protein
MWLSLVSRILHRFVRVPILPRYLIFIRCPPQALGAGPRYKAPAAAGAPGGAPLGVSFKRGARKNTSSLPGRLNRTKPGFLFTLLEQGEVFGTSRRKGDMVKSAVQVVAEVSLWVCTVDIDSQNGSMVSWQ